MGLPGAFDALRDERMWVAWADEGGRKVPKSPHGGNARSNDPSTWGTYAEAEAVRARNGYSGVGLMLTDGYVGIDLDNVIGEDGAIADWARDVIDELGSYAEFSPSGTGVHVIAWADPNEVGPVGRANHQQGIEAYNHGRYFTVTGDELPGEGSIRDVTRALPEFVSRHFSGESPEQAVRRRVGNLARDQVKRQANRTMAENCARDGVRYARVPVGSETCGFCIMLASRGFVYTTPEAASHAHDGCDCKVMPGFDGMEVEGYDPDSMYDLYAEARERAEHKTDAEISREIERIILERDGNSDWVGSTESGISRKRNAIIDADVNFDIIDSPEYLSSFRGLTGNDDVDSAIAKYARAALYHRTGTANEDLFLISMENGELAAHQTSSSTPLSVDRSDDVDEAVASHPRGSLFAVHNHPSNIPPTGSDLVTSGARGYGGAVVALHDGGVYYYHHGDRPFSAVSFDMTVDKHRKNGENIIEAFESALGEFERRYGIVWRKVR